MMRRLSLSLALFLALVPSPPASAQDPAGAAAAVVQDGGAAPAADAAQPSAALPQSPGTGRAYWHVFIAFGLAWALLFGYAVILGRRFGALERKLDRLEEKSA